MFTGIIQSRGSVSSKEARGGDVRLSIKVEQLDLTARQIGDSIAVNGVCLTVVNKTESEFSCDVSNETLNHTTLGALQLGSSVNLEAALLAHEPLGGHFVSGHVDGKGRIASLAPESRSIIYKIEVPKELTPYIARKGSICVDGVSLTVNEVAGCEFSVNIIPHTADQTLFGDYQQGDDVNIEIDLLSRYVQRLLQTDSAWKSGGNLSEEFLAEHGFSGDK